MTTESRTALVTGASSGIGAAIALEMAALGWKIAIGARRTDRLAETARKARAEGAAQVYAGDLDVTDDASIERFFQASEKAVRVADVIVNNAGASRFHWLEETDPRWLRSEVETNLIGPMVVTQRALAPLLAAGMDADVVMMSSDAARRPLHEQARRLLRRADLGGERQSEPGLQRLRPQGARRLLDRRRRRHGLARQRMHGRRRHARQRVRSAGRAAGGGGGAAQEPSRSRARTRISTSSMLARVALLPAHSCYPVPR